MRFLSVLVLTYYPEEFFKLKKFLILLMFIYSNSLQLCKKQLKLGIQGTKNF